MMTDVNLTQMDTPNTINTATNNQATPRKHRKLKARKHFDHHYLLSFGLQHVSDFQHAKIEAALLRPRKMYQKTFNYLIICLFSNPSPSPGV